MKTNVHLQRDVLDELDWEPSVDASNIGVAAHEGLVTLTGHVPVYSEKHAAEEAAKRVYGVRAVANEIEVRPEGIHARDDEEIAAAALHVLAWDAEVPQDRLQVVVEDGWITVEGTVEAQFQKVAVDRALRHLVGTRGVTNAVVVADRAMSDQVKASIEDAIARSATLNSKELGIEVDGGTIILTGDVHSHAELDAVQQIAWTAPGVRFVQNCLTLTPWGCGPAEEWGY